MINSVKIDIHGLTTQDAESELDHFLEYLDDDVDEVVVVHGYKGGTSLRDMVRKQFRHPRIKKKYISMNQGITILELK
jgi:DNA-nicking Smr family endonuclease